MADKTRMTDKTRVVHAGRDPATHHGAVNTPVYHASTIIHPTLATIRGTEPLDYTYGRRGTPTTRDLESALAELEGAAHCFICPSGVAAIATAVLACVKTGDHILVVDTAYQPTRNLCNGLLKHMGIEVSYYPPRIGKDIADQIRDNTSVIFMESPGSNTFEVQDVPAICAVAQAQGITTIIDNTWASPLYFKPFRHGVDISVSAATKYVVGHADALLGTVTCNTAYRGRVKAAYDALGQCAGPDDAYLAARGLRTLATRLERHAKSALAIADWLDALPFIRKLLYPAHPSSEDHALWQRDFEGASGLFGFITDPIAEPALAAMLDNMALFPMGYSWGGYESLLIPPKLKRDVSALVGDGTLLRIHIGLEDVEDLKADLAEGFRRAGFVIAGRE